MGEKQRYATLTALRIRQRPDVPMFVFAVGGKVLTQLFSVDGAHRSADGELHGYQRSRVTSHINDIRRYLLSDDAILPNAIVVSLSDAATTFEPLAGSIASDWGTPGRLKISLPRRGEARPGLVIDGQQRMSALAGLPPERNFAVVVVGFVAASEEMQRDQFVLVNRSKPLPRDLLNELLPQVEASLPPGLERKQSAATVLARLRFDQESIFKGRIRGIGTDGAGATISQSALLTIIESSLRSGLLSRLAVRDGVLDAEVAARVLNIYFSGVARTWPDAWEASSWSSRLVHGVGIYGMGRLMEEVLPTVNWESSRAVLVVSRRLEQLKPFCAWTDGRWPVLNCRWNDLQNTSQDKRRLANYLKDTFEAVHR